MHFLKVPCRPGSISTLIVMIGLIAWNSSCTANARNVPGIDSTNYPESFEFGRTATAEEIAAWDIDIGPDGTGLPEGSGNVRAGSNVYALKCAACHGTTGREGPMNKLVGAIDDTIRAKTIGNYWPYATTLFDYIRRTMPYNQPGSLTDEEVYNLCAYLLYQNKIIDSSAVINKKSLPAVIMPAQKYFVPDDRKGGPEIR